MYMTINERFRIIVEKLYGGNITAMAKATYISRTTINSIIGEKEVSPGYEVIRKIAEKSPPKISLDWLITGAGDMLVGTSQDGTTASNNIASQVNEGTVIIKLLTQLEEKDKQIAARDKQITELIELLKK